MTELHRVEMDPLFPGLGIIVVTDAAGAQFRYRMKDGILYPGRVWTSTITKPEAYKVLFFIPFPDGVPEVLKVEAV